MRLGQSDARLGQSGSPLGGGGLEFDTGLHAGHLLTGNETDVNEFHHWSDVGAFIETINFSAHVSVGFAFALGFAQYGTSVYVLVSDQNGYHAVLEYDSSLTFVRNVGRVCLNTDPAQNPDSVSAGFFDASDIAMDSAGNIYIGSFANLYRTYVFQYANDGSFTGIIQTDAVNPTTPLWAIHPTTGNLYLNNIKYNETAVTDDFRTVILQRFDPTGAAIDTTTVFTTPDSPAFQYGETPQERKGSFDCDLNFYVGTADTDSTAGENATVARIHKLDPALGVTSLVPTLPTGTFKYPRAVRPTPDASHLWVKLWGNGADDKTYMYQCLASDGSLVIDKIEIAPFRDLNAEVFVYYTSWPCGVVTRRRRSYAYVSS